MHATINGRQRFPRLIRVFKLHSRLSVPDRTGGLQGPMPMMRQGLVTAPAIAGAAAYQEFTAFRCGGETVAIDRQQFCVYKRVKQRPELIRANTERDGDVGAGQRAIIQRREDIQLHASQHSQRAVNRLDMPVDRDWRR